MKKLSLALFAISIMAMAALAQGKADYSGKWQMDKEKSTLAGQMRVDAMTLTVVQTAKEIKVDTESKRLPPANMQQPPAGAPAGPPPAGTPGGGQGRGLGGRGFGGFGGGSSSATYSLDGKELKVEVDGPNGKMPVIYKGTAEANGSLKLSSSRSFTGPMGEITMVTKETWTLSPAGATPGRTTPNSSRDSTTPRGAQTSKLVFTKG